LEGILSGSTKASDIRHAHIAVATLNHEHIHALGPKSLGRENGWVIVDDATSARPANRGPRNIEEAVTEWWSEISIIPFIQETGLGALEPRLLENQDYFSSYPTQVALLRPVVESCADLCSLPVDQIVRLMARQVPDTRAIHMARLILWRKKLSRHPAAKLAIESIATVLDHFLDFKLTNPSLGHGHLAASNIRTAIYGLEHS
jgi:hypothetical protein